LIEKSIQLEGVSLVDFLGVENENINELASLFPTAKIVARGEEIKIKGSMEMVNQLYDVLELLLQHYQNHEPITKELIYRCVNQEGKVYEAQKQGDIVFHGTRGRIIRPRTVNQEKIMAAMTHHSMAFVIGPAGTGKTYMSVALALQALRNKEVKKIVITRPMVEAGESLGFLPGYLEEKTAPYLYPIYDAIDDMVSVERRKYYQEQNMIEIAPLAYMRGRTLQDAFVILDEGQNTTTQQMKMFLTRMGMQAKFIITGDITQTDLPSPKQSGLLEAIKVLENTKGIAFVYLDEQDVVRHKLVKSIIKAYEGKGL
jgi:phosphate starvation-inducible PhoH-like protein